MSKINKLLNKSIEESYIKLSPIEHILKKPGMYIGDLDFRNEKQFIYKNNSIIQEEISWSPGLYKIVDELIVNVYDQTIRDKTLSIISVTLNPDLFSIFNDGIGIDVILHPIHKIYVPELIFANLLTSTNYDENEQRITGGTHGLGAKLSAIFSKKFTIQVWDSTRKLYYFQTFENNLSKISKPIIKKYNKVSDILDIDKNNFAKIKGGLSITIEPDFEKFKTDKFSNDMIQLLSRRVVDLIGLVQSAEKVHIYLNGESFAKQKEQGESRNEFESYLNLYKSEQSWIISHCVKNPLWSFAIRFNDGKSIDIGTQISFVNGIFTNRSGKHVDYIYDLLLEKFKKLIGPDFTKKILYDYVTLCLKASVVNPTFNSQTKEELNTPISKFGITLNNISMGCIIPDSFWNQIKNSPILIQLKNVFAFSNQKILAKLDGTKKNKIKNLPKLEDANYAGTKKSNECVLILTEGDSAKATAISGISAIPSGRNVYGVYPLRGKLLNVREASISQINNNQEITDIKKILGLKSGQNYNSSQGNINELRYGSVMIMTDADEDGSHIKGLIINFFDYFYPSLLEINGFMKILVTPLVKATKETNSKNTTVLNFANLRAYGIWKEKTVGSENWKIKYYKGLGTSTSKEAGEYFKNIKSNTIDIINSNANANANANANVTASPSPSPDILLAFAKEKIPDRKIWLSNYNPDNILQLEPPSTITIKQFIHQELIHFSNYDNIRSIPSIADGFKPSQRKVIYACLKRNLIGESKVAQLAAAVAELSAYHHGEQSLVSTIINMAQNFVGTNNLNLLSPQGQFGTRLMGGKDHSSARYIYTMLESYVKKIFIKIDSELLEYLDDDGYKIEPKYYIPIIPLILVNGTEGIGTGFSTSIPTFNPIDIIKWLENKLTGKQNKTKLIPYYKGFTGTIINYDDTTWLSRGVFTINYKTRELVITELPIKLWTNDYKEWLEELIYESKTTLFKSYTNLSSDIGINFILKFTDDTIDEIKRMENTIDSDGLSQLYKYLHLYKTIKQSNMNLYTVNYSIKTFKSAEEILEEFYLWRLTFYDKRRDLLLTKFKDEMNYINNQIKFIELVINNNSVSQTNFSPNTIFNMDPIQMDKYLETNKIGKIDNSYDYLTNMTFKQLTNVNLLKLNEKLNEIKKLYKNIESKSNKNLWLEDLIDLTNSILQYNGFV
jgi:DNA topoisomerase-2